MIKEPTKGKLIMVVPEKDVRPLIIGRYQWNSSKISLMTGLTEHFHGKKGIFLLSIKTSGENTRPKEIPLNQKTI